MIKIAKDVFKSCITEKMTKTEGFYLEKHWTNPNGRLRLTKCGTVGMKDGTAIAVTANGPVGKDEESDVTFSIYAKDKVYFDLVCGIATDDKTLDRYAVAFAKHVKRLAVEHPNTTAEAPEPASDDDKEALLFSYVRPLWDAPVGSWLQVPESLKSSRALTRLKRRHRLRFHIYDDVSGRTIVKVVRQASDPSRSL